MHKCSCVAMLGWWPGLICLSDLSLFDTWSCTSSASQWVKWYPTQQVRLCTSLDEWTYSLKIDSTLNGPQYLFSNPVLELLFNNGTYAYQCQILLSEPIHKLHCNTGVGLALKSKFLHNDINMQPNLYNIKMMSKKGQAVLLIHLCTQNRRIAP